MGGKENRRTTNRQRGGHILLGLLVSWSSAVVAQPSGGATPTLASPVVLSVPWSARGAAMGGAYLAGDDADVLFTNPAALTQARGLTVGAMRTDDAMRGASVAAVTTLGGWSLGVGVRAMRLNTPRATVIALRGETGEVPDPAFRAWRAAGVDGSAAVTAGAARRVGPVRVGLSLHAANDAGTIPSAGEPLSTTVAGDIGLTMPVAYGSFALVARAVGPDPSTDGLVGSPLARRMPTRFLVGYGVPLLPLWSFFDLGGQFAYGVRADGTFEGRGGLELAFAPVDGVGFVARAGSSRMDGVQRATWGLGVTIDRVAFDMAYEPDPAAPGWRLGLRIR